MTDPALATDPTADAKTGDKPRSGVADLGPVRLLPIDLLQPAPDNPRKITTKAVEVVARSLSTFGWQQPLVVDKAGTIIAGHTRYRAAVMLGLREVPVTVAENLSADAARAYRIADNRTGDFSSWDFTELAAQLEDLSADFADVLALADWQQIVAEFDDLTPDGPSLPDGALEPDDALAIYAGEKYSVIVVADSEAAIRRVAAVCVDMDGVLDVRDRNVKKPKP